MRVTFHQPDVELATRIARPSLNPIMPIYGHLLLEAQNDHLRLTAVAPESYVIVTVGAQVSQPGAIAVPSRLFSDLISLLQPSQLEMWTSGHQLHIVQGEYIARISCLSAEEFPALDNESFVPLAEVDSTTFREAMAQVGFCVSGSGIPVFSGILMERKAGEGITAVATDSFRMAVCSFSASGLQEFRAVVPAKIVKEVSQVCSYVPSAFPIRLSATQDMRRIMFDLVFPERFALQRAIFVSQLIPGSYPDYSQIIPNERTVRVTVSASELMNACLVAQIFASSRALQITTNSAKQQLQICASSPEGTGEVKIAARIVGGEAQFAINSEYVVEMLRAIRASEVVIDFLNPVRPVCFRIPGRDDWVGIIMPLVSA